MALKQKHFWICDKKPGACRGWPNGWKRCENDMCYHTTNIEHARNGVSGHNNFAIIRTDDEEQFWEYTSKCTEPFRCTAQMEINNEKYCADGECPLNHGACQE